MFVKGKLLSNKYSYSARSVKVIFFKRILEISIYAEDSRELI